MGGPHDDARRTVTDGQTVTSAAETATTGAEQPRQARSTAAAPVSQLVVALAVVALGAVMVIQGWGRPFLVPGRGTGPLALPLIVGVVLIAMGVLLAGRTLLRHDPQAPVAWPTGTGRQHLIGYMLLSVVYVALVNWLGFLVANVVVGILCLRLLGGYTWPRAALLAGMLAIGLTLAFEVALNVTLPRGLVSF